MYSRSNVVNQWITLPHQRPQANNKESTFLELSETLSIPQITEQNTVMESFTKSSLIPIQQTLRYQELELERDLAQLGIDKLELRLANGVLEWNNVTIDHYEACEQKRNAAQIAMNRMVKTRTPSPTHPHHSHHSRHLHRRASQMILHSRSVPYIGSDFSTIGSATGAYQHTDSKINAVTAGGYPIPGITFGQAGDEIWRRKGTNSFARDKHRFGAEQARKNETLAAGRNNSFWRRLMYRFRSGGNRD